MMENILNLIPPTPTILRHRPSLRRPNINMIPLTRVIRPIRLQRRNIIPIHLRLVRVRIRLVSECGGLFHGHVREGGGREEEAQEGCWEGEAHRGGEVGRGERGLDAE